MQTQNIIHFFFCSWRVVNIQITLPHSSVNTGDELQRKSLYLVDFFSSLLRFPTSYSPSFTGFNNCCQRTQVDRDVHSHSHFSVTSSVPLSVLLRSNLLFITQHMWPLTTPVLMVRHSSLAELLDYVSFTGNGGFWGSVTVSTLTFQI